ncbi:MAG TPA: PadR family transcriptional regulator [Vicinamibacterales bacterium]|nr:PadR family transcriptional regulator [Vicinamibacterales bacterium]
MGQISILGELEQMVLLAVLRLDEPYPVSVRDEIRDRTNVSLSRGTIYVTLHRLERRGLVKSSLGEPTGVRGGKAKRVFEVTANGRRALRASRAALRKLGDGLESILDGRS